MKIRSKKIIKLQKEIPVYDVIDVETNNNFILENGIVSHNCAPPKVGKTTLLCQEGAYFCKNNIKVAHVCFTGDTKIKTLEGEKTLEDLYKSKIKNFKVYSYDKKDKKIDISVAKEVKLMKEVEELLELEFENHYKVKCTPDHKFLTKKGYIEAQNLNEKDQVIRYDLDYLKIKRKTIIKLETPVPVYDVINVEKNHNFFLDNGACVSNCLGDMDNIDVICKYISHLTGDPMEVIIENPVKYFTEFPHIKEIIKNVRISCFPAGELGVKELLGHLRQLKQNFNFDAVIVDYDSNIAPPKGENMYEVGGIIYTALKGFAEKERCVLFVGSQPKINFWETEKLDMSSASESSRKQHTIDAMITMGRNKDCKHLGTYNIACMRRGSGGVAVRIKFDYKNSTIKEISQNEYDKILNEYKKLTNDKLTTMSGGEGFSDSLSK